VILLFSRNTDGCLRNSNQCYAKSSALGLDLHVPAARSDHACTAVPPTKIVCFFFADGEWRDRGRERANGALRRTRVARGGGLDYRRTIA